MDKKIIDLLEEKFDRSQIKKRPGSFGKTLDYIPGPVIIQRLNKAFNHDWSFHIVSQEIVNGFVITRSEICVKDDKGNVICKAGVGGKKITMTKAFPNKPSEILDIGNDYKASSVDSLKKAATLFGVALDLYGELVKEDDEDEVSEEATKDKESVPEKDRPIQESQKNAITKMISQKGLTLEGFWADKKIKSMEELTESQAKEIILQLNVKK